MKNFFQRKQDPQPNRRSRTPANESHKIWLPPQDTSRGAAPAPTAWASTTAQSSARRGGETHRSSSRAPRADASAVPTSSAYKYATLPNSTGLYYSNNTAPLAQPVPIQPYSQQYYPSPAPRPPPPPPIERPDSRLGYSYPYPNPQSSYPQAFTVPPAPPPSQAQTHTAPSKKREDKTRNTRGPTTAPESSRGRPITSRNDDGNRVPRQPSSSSIREQKREDVEVKKPKHRPREPSETRKRRDSQVGDPYAEKSRDKSSRKEPRRDGKSRSGMRAEEGDSSDSSAQRPSSGHRRRSEEGKSSSMTDIRQQGPTPFPASSRTGLPMQPTAASSSSGKQTPQIPPRMPVYLPANHGRRPSEDQLGQSESDTDGALNRGRNFLRATALPNSKQPAKTTNAAGGPSSLTMLNKKVKESKGLWPFSRSKSSQKPPPAVVPKITAQKIRADSTPSRFPVDDRPLTGRPEYRRQASDSAIGGHFDPFTGPTAAPQETRLSQPEPPTSRALFFATQANESSSRPIATASQQAALYSSQPRPPGAQALSAPNPGAQAISQPPNVSNSSSSRQHPVPQSGFPPGQMPNFPTGPNPMLRPETPLRRDGRDTSTLPPLYAPARPSDYPRVPDRSSTPKVSQLVAGFEARSSEAQTHILPQANKPPSSAARREVVEKPSLPRMYVPPQQSGSASTQASGMPNPQLVASQPPPRIRTTSGSSIRPLVDSSNQTRPVINQPEVLKTALRDLLTDKPAVSRDDERSQRKAHESRNNQGSAPPPVYPTSASSQPHPFAQPPIQIYNAGVSTSSIPFQSSSKGERRFETTQLPNPSSRRPDVFQSDSADRTSRTGASSKPGNEARDAVHGRSSRSKKEKDIIVVMKTPSKDSSRHTSTPSPVIMQSTQQSRSNDKSSSSQPSTSRSQPQPVSVDMPGRHVPAIVPPNAPSSSSLGPGDRPPQRDSRPPTTKHPSSRDLPPNTTSNVPTSSSSERSRPVPSTSALPFPSNQPQPVASRGTVPLSSSTPTVEVRSSPPAQSGSRPTRSSSPRRHMRRMPSEESILKTPSSLAHSILPPLQPTTSRTSIPASTSSERKKGIFGMFRSKETQQSEPQLYASHPSRRPRSPDRDHSSSENVNRKLKAKVPPPITVPNPALPISERKSPNSRGVFTPFRYLSTKRNRRVSTASMDAVDGTAPNTVMGSPTASMQSSQVPPHSPPQRDPRVATQDWRNQEETATLARGKRRRMRPGVVFDVAEDPLEETKRSKPMRIKKPRPSSQAAQAEQPTTTDSSDG